MLAKTSLILIQASVRYFVFICEYLSPMETVLNRLDKTLIAQTSPNTAVEKLKQVRVWKFMMKAVYSADKTPTHALWYNAND